MDPHSPETFLYLRAIQGHSEGAHINPTLQDNVLLPDDVAEHIYHVGSSRYALDHSIGIDSGWQRRQERVTCVVLYVREPDVRRSAQRSRVRPDESQNWNKKHWKTHQNTVYWCKWKVAQKKELQFHQTRSNAIILYNTLSEICIKNVVCRKSREALYNKVFQSPRLSQKAVLKPNLYHGHQDSCNFEARTSVDHQSKDSEGCGETRGDSNSCRGTEEFGGKTQR